jgi:hypothetical protein
MDKKIYDIIREMVLLGVKPAKVVAQEVGKTYSTFMRELNAEDKGAKLGIEMLLPIMEACDSILPLRYMASRMHCRVVSLRDVIPDKPSLLEELLDTYPAVAEYHRAIMDDEPAEIVAELREQVIRQVQEDFVAFIHYRKKSVSGETAEAAGE